MPLGVTTGIRSGREPVQRTPPQQVLPQGLALPVPSPDAPTIRTPPPSVYPSAQTRSGSELPRFCSISTNRTCEVTVCSSDR